MAGLDVFYGIVGTAQLWHAVGDEVFIVLRIGALYEPFLCVRLASAVDDAQNLFLMRHLFCRGFLYILLKSLPILSSRTGDDASVRQVRHV